MKKQGGKFTVTFWKHVNGEARSKRTNVFAKNAGLAVLKAKRKMPKTAAVADAHFVTRAKP